MATKQATKGALKSVKGSNNPYLHWGGVTFSDEQRRRLSELPLCLTREQIDAMEAILSAITLALRGGPTITQQRDALERMASALEEIKAAFSVPADLTDNDGLGLVLRRRLDKAHREDRDYRDDADLLRDQAIRLTFTVRTALASIPSGAQARNRTASYWPIELIDKALQPHPYPIGGAVFRELCGVAYEAATGTAIDPQRAILAYLKHRR